MKVSALLLLFLTAVSPPAFAFDLSTPAGHWLTTDFSGRPTGIIRIDRVDGEYRGFIEKIFPAAGEPDNPRCVHCAGERKNQPFIGLNLLWGLKEQGDEYGGGEILDPRNGMIYPVRLKLEDGGKKLDVRGFVGVPLFGRSLVWNRVD
jgi:uncharacterized protein (DUF2147 family)